MAARAGARAKPRWTLSGAFADRYREVVASIYIYNEHRGYTSLDRVMAAARQVCPDDHAFLQAIAKHRTDERKHYLMFKNWFERQGRMPLATGRGYGHIDRFIRIAFGCTIDDLEVDGVVANPARFEKLCNVIVLTEQRGLRQVEELLANPMIRADRAMHGIFAIIHHDEPDHFLPYADWLEREQRPGANWRERLADAFIHKILLLVKLPVLFFRPGARRMELWPDAGEANGKPLPSA
ncbi:MAG: ferritin-like domain-containing protein [Novosphingobium sp.]